jgi:flagellar motor switch protein FliG
MSEENIIVLTLYGKEKTISHISASIFDSKDSAKNFCDNINEFPLQESRWVYARVVGENEKIEPIIPKCMDMKFLNIYDDFIIQNLARDIDDRDWAFALTDSDDGTKERIFQNMSKQREKGLKEEMAAMGPVPFDKINEARYKIFKYARKTYYWVII